jgi:hypothetical protein
MDQQNLPGSTYKPMTIGEWLITFIITYIPLVGFIMLFVWAFGGDVHPSKKTWAQATLIIFAIGIVLAIIFAGIIITLIGSMFSAMGSYS